MSIALFIIFLFMNFFILLIMKFVYTSNYSYTEGMLLGVHIPKEHIEDETVLNIVAAARRKMNRIIWINLILGTALCFVGDHYIHTGIHCLDDRILFPYNICKQLRAQENVCPKDEK